MYGLHVLTSAQRTIFTSISIASGRLDEESVHFRVIILMSEWLTRGVPSNCYLTLECSKAES